MKLFSFLRRLWPRRKPTQSEKPRHRPRIEMLEERQLLARNAISGVVYEDINANGLLEFNEARIANSTIELREANGAVVARTTTAGDGSYRFDRDPRVSTQPVVGARMTAFTNEKVPWDPRTAQIQQFDADLGTLTRVRVVETADFMSTLVAESVDQVPRSVTFEIGGSITLNAPGIQPLTATNSRNVSFDFPPFDGNADFSGPSSRDFGALTLNLRNTFDITDPAVLAQYIGTGTVTVSTITGSSIVARGQGSGNVDTRFRTNGVASITLEYTYIPNDCLKPGDYKIFQVPQPAGFLDGKESSNGAVLANSIGVDCIPVRLVPNIDSPNNNFGEVRPASLSGCIFIDSNNDCIQQPNERGIPNCTVTLTGTNDAGQRINLTASSNQSGVFTFGNLRPGQYTLTGAQKPGLLDGKDQVGNLGGTLANDRMINIQIRAGDVGTGYCFAELEPASIGGCVYVDNNDDGFRQSSEPFIPGVRVTLTGTDDRGQPVTATQTTGQDGKYRFTNLRPGTYSIKETQPTQFSDGKDTIGTPGGLTPQNDCFTNIQLPSGFNGENNNFGERLLSSIGGCVYIDSNNDGIFQPAESPIAGVLLTLTGTDDQGQFVTRTTTTDGAGKYRFPDLRPGTYQVKETQPAACLDGRDTVGDQGGTSPLNDCLAGIALRAGVTANNYNFGELKPGSLGGMVYRDVNNNGIMDAGDTAIAGVIIRLLATDGSGRELARALTDGNGNYQFNNLAPGVYHLQEIQPAGFVSRSNNLGTLGGTQAGDNFWVNLGSGQAGTNYKFGEVNSSVLPPPTGGPKLNFLGSTFLRR